MLFVNGIVHPKMEILSSFTHPEVFPNLYECVCLNTNEDILKKVCNRAVLCNNDFHSRREIPLCFPHSSEYLHLCSEQTHSYRFGNTSE